MSKRRFCKPGEKSPKCIPTTRAFPGRQPGIPGRGFTNSSETNNNSSNNFPHIDPPVDPTTVEIPDHVEHHVAPPVGYTIDDIIIDIFTDPDGLLLSNPLGRTRHYRNPTTTGVIDYFRNQILERYWHVYRASSAIDINNTLRIIGTGALDIRGFVKHEFPSWQNVSIEATLVNTASGNSILNRVDLAGDDISGYLVEVVNVNTLTLFRVDNEVLTVLDTDATLLLAAGDRIRLTCTGTSVLVYLNDAEILSAIDATYTSGYVGLGVVGTNTQRLFSKVEIATV